MATMFKSRGSRKAALCLALTLPVSAVQARGAMSEQEFLDYLRSLSEPVSSGSASFSDLQGSVQSLGMLSAPPPSVSTFGINSGFGLPGGSAFAAGALTDTRDRAGSDADGSGALGFGFGDARDSIGADISIGIISVDPRDFGEDGNVNARIFRHLPGITAGGVSGVAVGVSNGLRWGDAKDINRNYFISGSTIVNLRPDSGYTPLMLTAGYGTAIKNIERDPAAFAGVGVGLTSRFSASVSWGGDEWMAGVGIRPFLSHSAQITLGVGDATNRLDGRRWIITGSWFLEDLF
ncbi:hypothetical protein [uncultured Marinobacter sp.]|uniref:hypothetical protein n=1 Tax=uncultured Marinobacter sp. TaxID=187379 RepID=UPI002585ACF1|nr:hypothetical protein [uncultured Marinobacter sp.]